MTLEYITNSIDKKIYKNKAMIIYTFNELRVREELSKEELSEILPSKVADNLYEFLQKMNE